MSDVGRAVKDKQRRQRAREQLLKMNKRKKEDKVRTHPHTLTPSLSHNSR